MADAFARGAQKQHSHLVDHVRAIAGQEQQRKRQRLENGLPGQDGQGGMSEYHGLWVTSPQPGVNSRLPAGPGLAMALPRFRGQLILAATAPWPDAVPNRCA